MRFSPKLLALALAPICASCSPSPQKVASTPTPMTSSPSSSPASSETKPQEAYVPCASLAHGQVSRSDTTATLAWVLPLVETIDKTCELPAK